MSDSVVCFCKSIVCGKRRPRCGTRSKIQSLHKWIFFIVYLFFTIFQDQCQGATDSDLKMFQDIVEEVLKCRNVPAVSLTLVKDNKVLMAKSLGYSDPENKIKANARTKFCIGSLTKAFTATVLSKLVNERENFTFDTPIREIMDKSFRLNDDARTNEVSLRDLLSHRVGIPQYFKALLAGIPLAVSREELVRRLRFMTPTEPLRTKFLYNNYMYTLAGHIAERMAGKSWERVVDDLILKPLKMTESGFIDLVHDFTNFALPCAIKNGKIVNLDPMLLHSVRPCGPAGSIYSTASDMSKWLLLLLNSGLDEDGKRIFKSKVLQDLHEPGMPRPFKNLDIAKPTYPVVNMALSYDMAWMTSVYRGYKLIWHSGGIITHSSRLWMFPDRNIAIYAVANGPQTKHKGHALTAIMSYASDMLLGETSWLNKSTVCTFPGPWESPFVSLELRHVKSAHIVPITVRPAEDYIGKYFHRAFGEIHVFMNGSNKLSLTFGRYGFLNISPKSETMFFGWYYGPLWFVTASDDSFTPVTIVFVKSNNSDIVGLIFPVDEMYNDTYFQKDKPVDMDVSYKISGVCTNSSSASEQLKTLYSILTVCIFAQSILL
ncbi:uncharacterized protein LOC121375670 [Gigantopelta aegis]|uniref:uncharacterized protein LOC121375670 n=1 Tax=Gigantopelta aegis TaxID=1735272 RepID=UPI001B88E4E0|nr:uncharacterized protein LOC121375670 [Gigantopelta aegis]